MIKQKRKSEAEKFPHYIKLPKNSKSPTDSIYKRFDIKMQTKAVNSYSNNPTIIRCAHPFILTVQVGKKIKDIESRVK